VGSVRMEAAAYVQIDTYVLLLTIRVHGDRGEAPLESNLNCISAAIFPSAHVDGFLLKRARA
jgi:hypothetical protein